MSRGGEMEMEMEMEMDEMTIDERTTEERKEQRCRLEALPVELLNQIVEDLAGPPHSPRNLIDLLCASRYLRPIIEPVLYSRPDDREVAMRWACTHDYPNTITLLVEQFDQSPGYVRIRRNTEFHHGPWLHLSQVYPSSPRGVDEPLVINDKFIGQDTADRSPFMRVPTLILAAKHGNAKSFKTLLELGARIENVSLRLDGSPTNSALIRTQQKWFKVLVNHIFSKKVLRKAPDIARLFFRHNLDVDAKAAAHQGPDVYAPLIRAIVADAPYDIVQTILDRYHYSPGRVFSGFGFRYCLTPLSAAIIARSPRLLESLLASGRMDINETFDIRPSPYAKHKAVFACVHLIASTEDLEVYNCAVAMMKMCVEAGADINSEATMLCNRNKRRAFGKMSWKDTYHIQFYHYGYPIHVFLRSVAAWTRTAPYTIERVERVGHGPFLRRRLAVKKGKPKYSATAPEPLERLILLMSLGVDVDSSRGGQLDPDWDHSPFQPWCCHREDLPQTRSDIPHHTWSNIHSTKRCISRTQVRLSPLQCLRHTWDIFTVAYFPSCEAVYKHLISTAPSAELFTNLLCQISIDDQWRPLDSVWHTTKFAVGVLGDLLAQNMPGSGTNKAFFVYLVAIVLWGEAMTSENKRILDIMVDSRKANVNFLLSCYFCACGYNDSLVLGDYQHLFKLRGKVTIPYYLCWIENRMQRRYPHHDTPQCSILQNHYSEERRLHIFRYMLSKGVNVGIMVDMPEGGRTAKNVLFEGADDMPAEDRENIEIVAKVLRGEDTEKGKVINSISLDWEDW